MVDVPIEIEPEPDDPGQALPYVWIEIGGRTVRALLDSGSARTTVTPPHEAILHTRRPEGSGLFGGRGGDRRVWRTSIRLAGVDVGSIEVDTHNLGQARDLVGQDVLSQFRCEYRFADRQLRLDGSAPPEDTCSVFISESRHVYLDVAWPPGPVTASAVFDTGASVTVADATFVQEHPALFTPAGASQGVDASGAVLQTPMVSMTGPQVLGRMFTATTAAVVDLTAVNQTIRHPMHLILGWPLLRQANWLIDHPKRLAALTT